MRFLHQVVANWKSFSTGVFILAISAAMFMGKIDFDQFLALNSAATGAGFMLAKDANK